MTEIKKNPDVLECLASLSNDEVFTPPKVVNNILDMLPESLWSNPNAKFLDPCCKSGIFLREIAKRLIDGLKDVYPDLRERINHICKQQLYGVAITDLTALLSRRSVYCSKTANGVYSICTSKFTEEGNIFFEPQTHTWSKGRCIYCGASEKNYGRSSELESHAYQFIHDISKEELFKMKFDVIIGNPPYQLSTAGSVESQATPIYDKFVKQAQKLNPRYLCMIIPSRWMNGGFALDNFREDMINDRHIRTLHDFINANDCFPGISLTGGVCYFLWDRDHEGPCHIYTHNEDGSIVESERYLKTEGIDTFIRLNDALSILQKVRIFEEPSFSSIVSQRDPFGLNYFEDGRERMFKLFENEDKGGFHKIYYFGWKREGIKYCDPKYVTTNIDAIDKYKVFISKANGAASSKAPYSVLSKPFVSNPGEICNMTYLMIGPFESESMAKNACEYISTKFFRFLVSLMKNTQNAYSKVYTYVPMQDFNESWTDKKLYEKYGLNSNEIEFIENLIKEMGEDSDE